MHTQSYDVLLFFLIFVKVIIMATHLNFLVFVCCMISNNAADSRERYSLNFDWLFHIGNQDLQHAQCTTSAFKKESNQQCQEFMPIYSVSKNNTNGCANACCASPTCAFFQITSSGQCEIGNIISIYNAFSWTSDCKSNSAAQFYSRPNTPDTDPSHFSAATKNFDDSKWPKINIPHDFVVHGTFVNPTPEQEPRSGSHGYLPKNTSWYRKHFSLPTSYKNATLWIDFDGIYRNSITFINGKFLGNHSSGYTSFRYYLDAFTDSLEFGDNSDNVLSIFVDATAEEGWWYEGGGIYRNVFLNKASKVFFEPAGGIYLPATVSTVHADGTGDSNLIINATINNRYNIEYNVNVKFEIIKPDGNVLKTLTSNNVVVAANKAVSVGPSSSDSNVELWSVQSPALYRVNATIFDSQNNEMDFVSLSYGYRKAVFDVNRGLYLNDKPVKIKGFCNHQDFGGTGIATPERINRFRVQHLKNMGANAWRMSHNPPNPELLAFADEYGFLIWDENRHFGNSPQWMDDQRDMILRDRNHPSVLIWSICNEAGCQKDTSGIDNVVVLFKNIIQKYDGIYNQSGWGYNRPIAGAGWLNPVLDFASANYNYDLDSYHKQHPTQSIISSESCSCTQDRNEYVSSSTTGHCSAYMNCPWNSVPCPDGCWKPVDETSYIIGSFDWTGFDYKGEPTPYSWPDINSHFGVNDMAGFPKDMYWYYRAAWTNIADEIILYIMPNTWNNDTNTNPEQVRVYTNCEYVELFVNNNSVSNGRQKVDALEYYALNVRWSAGVISCNCLDVNNKILASTKIETTDSATSIVLEWEYPYNSETAENNTIIGDGQDVALINVFVVDDKMRIVPNSKNLITFSLDNESVAFILGVSNGDPASHEPDKANQRSVFHGKARVLVQSMLNKGGKVILTAASNGLKTDTMQINVNVPQQKVLVL